MPEPTVDARTLRLRIWWAALLALAAATAAAQDVFLAGGLLVDPLAETVSRENLLILDGAIAGRPASVPQGFAGEVIDVTGKWVIPGLHDLHTHALTNDGPGGAHELLGARLAARRMLYAGVTGFLDLFNVEGYVFRLRDRQRASAVADGADIFASGSCLTAPRGHGTQYRMPARLVETPEEARREVRDLAGRKPDAVKLIYAHTSEETWRPPRPSIDRATLEAAVEAAAELGLPTVVHVRSWQDVRDSAEAGATAVTHLPDDPIPGDLAALMAARGTYLIPTLAVADPVLWTRPEALDSPLLRAVTSPAIVDSYRYDERNQRLVEGLGSVQPVRFRAVRELAEAGVPVLSGSDAGNLAVILGWSLHRELALLVEAGLSPWQALASSTTTAGELLGRAWGLSTGDEGSVVVLDASPIDDIANTERIWGVVHHGTLVDRELLAQRMFGALWTRETITALLPSLPALVTSLPRRFLLAGGLILVAIALAALFAGRTVLRMLGRRRAGRLAVRAS